MGLRYGTYTAALTTSQGRTLAGRYSSRADTMGECARFQWTGAYLEQSRAV